MRRLSLLLVAALLAVGAFVPSVLHAKPAHAVLEGCEVAGDVPGDSYTDWHAQTFAFTNDSWDPMTPNHWVGIDLWAWRMSWDPGDGVQHCYRAYYSSVWTNDGTPANVTINLQTFICGHSPPYNFAFHRNTVWSNRSDASTSYPTWPIWGRPGTSSILHDTVLPSGATVTLVFADYGIFPVENGCFPQADTNGHSAGSPTWTTDQGGPTLFSFPGVSDGWFCNDRNPPSGRNFYCG